MQEGETYPRKTGVGAVSGPPHRHIRSHRLTKGTKTCGRMSRSQRYLQIPYRLRNEKVFPWVTAPGLGGGFLLPPLDSRDSTPLIS